MPLSCKADQQACNGGRVCTQTIWDFEASSDKGAGWQTPGGKVTSAVVGEPFLTTSATAQVHGGGRALAVNLDVRPYRGIV